MATSGTSQLSSEVKPYYDGEYYMQCQSVVYWDQFADLRMQMGGQRGSTYNFPVIESGQPNYTALDELQDVSAAPMRANEVAITLAEYGGAIEVTKFVVATSYADVLQQAAYINGYNLAESVDYIARAVAGQGSRVFRANGRATRSVFAGQSTVADRASASVLEFLSALGHGLKMPMYEDGALVTCIHPFVYFDILQSADIRNMGIYSHPELLFNGELAYWGGLRIVMSNNAKAFWGAGAAPSSSVSTTLSTAAAIGDSSIVVASATNIVAGQWLAIIDTAETGNTWTDTNELFYVTSVSGTTISGFCYDPGPGSEGGIRFAHASGKTVTNANSVYPIVVLGPNSVTKVASSLTGPYGETVISGPFDRLGRFLSFGWYLLAGYGRTRESWLLRGEVGSATS